MSEQSWISTPEEAEDFVRSYREQGKKVVFTNGCFDLLHVGHVRYLQQARDLGDALVIALNSDASVSELKGPNRPINSEEDRAELLRALSCVDRVVVFHEPRATRVIEIIKPQIYAKGGDYTPESLNAEEKAALSKVGAEIHILPLVPGKSTTSTLAKLKTPESGSKKLKIGILGSGKGSNFKAILENMKNPDYPVSVQVVISDQEEAGILKLAREANLPAFFVTPGDKPNRLGDAAQKEIAEHLKRHEVDLVVLAGFMKVLKTPVLELYKDRVVNIHPSLLPKYKGRNAWIQALEAGDSEAGCTVHFVNEEIDSGGILAQSVVPILKDDTEESLYARIQEAEHELYPRVLKELSEKL